MRLSIQIEFDKALDLETNKTKVIVGRSPQCDLVIAHDAISRRHCEIDCIKGQYFITDLGSANGVFIDGQRLPPNQKTAFLLTQQLSFGTMECEISESKKGLSEDHKILSSTVAPGGDFTATVRLARLDLNKPSKTLELEKQIKVKGPRNPVSQSKLPPDEKAPSNKFFWIVLAFIVCGAAWYFAPISK